MKKIFISHSKFDQSAVSLLVAFLVNGIGVKEESIFCSSVDGHDIPVGVNFNDYIRDQLKDSNGCLTLAIISNDYYNSKYCLYELGAAWGIGDKKNIIPILIKNMHFGNLQDFISHVQAIDALKKKQINKLNDFIQKDSNISKKDIATSKFENERDVFIKKLGNITAKALGRKDKIKESNKFKYKVVAFDFDGTILQGKKFKHSWKAIWDFLNYPDDIRKELFEKHRNNHQEYTFQNWCDECVEYFIKRELKRSDIAKIVADNQLLVAEGFDELINVLYELKFKVIIISGGIDTFIHETISENTLQLIDKIFINKFFYAKNGELEKAEAYQNKDSDGVGKLKVLENYCIENEISLDQVIFIGDETNDIDVMKGVGKAVVYPGLTSSRFNKELGFKTIFENNITYALTEILQTKGDEI